MTIDYVGGFMGRRCLALDFIKRTSICILVLWNQYITRDGHTDEVAFHMRISRNTT